MFLRGSLPAFAALLALSACSTAEHDRREAARDLQSAREDGQRRAAEYSEFLNGYARTLGKSAAQLTKAEREDAQRIYTN